MSDYREERRSFASAELQKEGANKRRIMEALQGHPYRCTKSQANGVVRNQAKRLGLYNRLSKKEKAEALMIG